MTGAGSTWAFACKRNYADNQNFSGLWIGFAATGKGYYLGFFAGSNYVLQQTTYAGSGVSNVASISGVPTSQYYKVSFDGTNLHFSSSYDGILWTVFYSVAPSSFLGGAPDSVGMFEGAVSLPSGNNYSVSFDWFRKTA